MNNHTQTFGEPENDTPRHTVSPPLTVERVADTEPDGTETHQIRVTLSRSEMRTIIGHIARAVYQANSLHATLLAGRPPGPGEHLDQILRVEDLAQLLHLPGHTITLSPAEVDDLIIDLEEAALDSCRCACGQLVQQPTQLTTTCGSCVERLGGDR